jgi:hypothetical protein
VLSLTLLHPSRLLAIPVVAILALCVFFGVRHLNYQEFGELERFARRLRQQKQIAASNIALHKAASQLGEAKNAIAMVAVLERALQVEFDGFKIILDPGHWVTTDFDDSPARVLEKSWLTFRRHDTLVLMMDLSTPRYGKVGRLCLEHSATKRLMADSILLQGTFRHAVGLALERCMITMPEDVASDKKQAMAQHA